MMTCWLVNMMARKSLAGLSPISKNRTPCTITEDADGTEDSFDQRACLLCVPDSSFLLGSRFFAIDDFALWFFHSSTVRRHFICFSFSCVLVSSRGIRLRFFF